MEQKCEVFLGRFQAVSEKLWFWTWNLEKYEKVLIGLSQTCERFGG